MESNLITFENVHFTYDGKRNALDGITLSIGEGEFVCILGGNGSGKSTLAKHVNALLVPDEGSVHVGGLATGDSSNLYEIRSMAGMVFQNPDDQLVASIIEDDVAFGPENLGVPTDELRERVTQSLAEVGLQGFERKETTALSGGQKQRVAIAGALAMHPRILVLDEASAMLDPRGRKGLLRVCHELNEAGMTIIYITHFMEEAAHADRVIVLDAGRIALDGTPVDVFSHVEQLESLSLDVPFAATMSRLLQSKGLPLGISVDEDALVRTLADVFVPAVTSVADVTTPSVDGIDIDGAGRTRDAHCPVDALIAFEGVSFSYAGGQVRKKHARDKVEMRAEWGNAPEELWALRDIDLNVRRGEFLGIAGHTGSGKSTLVQLANGLLKPTEGRVRVNGLDLADKKNAVQARHDVGVVFQYPERQLFAASVRDDVAFGPRNMGFGDEEIAQRVRESLALVHLDVDAIGDTSPFALSGGEQRRVALAGVLAMRPTTLILDEPIAGLDPKSRAQLLALIEELRDEQGFTVVIVSHNMDDLARLCDRILVLNQGRRFALGTPVEVFADEERLRSVGLGVPHVVHLENELAARGLIAPHMEGIPSVNDLAECIAAAFAENGGR